MAKATEETKEVLTALPETLTLKAEGTYISPEALQELEQLRAEKAAREAKEAEAEKAQLKEELEAKRMADYMEELVTIQLFKGQEEKYKADLPVSVNGETVLVQRGKPVTLKRKFAEVIKNMEEQNAYAVSLMESLQSDYQAGQDKLN